MAFNPYSASQDAFTEFDRKHGSDPLWVPTLGLVVWSDGAYCERGNIDGAQDPDERADYFKLEYTREKLDRVYAEYRHKYDEARARSNPSVRARWGMYAAPPPSEQELEEIEELRDRVRDLQNQVNALQDVVDAKHATRNPAKEKETNRAMDAFNKLTNLKL